MERTVRIEFTVEDLNVVLSALGNEPFAKVYAIIGKIQEQAAEQLEADDDSEAFELPDDD